MDLSNESIVKKRKSKSKGRSSTDSEVELGLFRNEEKAFESEENEEVVEEEDLGIAHVEIEGESDERELNGEEDKLTNPEKIVLYNNTPAYHPPDITYRALFLKFVGFGSRAFGGAIGQIQMMKQQIVINERWMSPERFHRVFALYQTLPG